MSTITQYQVQRKNKLNGKWTVRNMPDQLLETLEEAEEIATYWQLELGFETRILHRRVTYSGWEEA